MIERELNNDQDWEEEEITKSQSIRNNYSKLKR